MNEELGEIKSEEIESINYHDVISNMMFGFGDHCNPDKNTVALIENITLSQLRIIVQEASKCIGEDQNELKGEHLVFLMRKNKYKMRRFVKYLRNKVIKAKINIDDFSLENINHKLLDFIDYIDETGELTDIDEYDEAKTERMLRADRMSLSINQEKYFEYSKARNASFASGKCSGIRNFNQLKKWIDPKKEMRINQSAFEPLSYYAYETVAQLVDYAFLVRLDTNRTTDPVKSIQGAYVSPSTFNPKDMKLHNEPIPISVNEIEEVMRRFYAPQAGKLSFGAKLPATHHILAI